MQPLTIMSAAVALIAMLLVSPRSTSAQIAVTACGQVVDGSGYLTGDLDCTGFFFAVLVRPRGSLDLRGFTITGGQDGVNCGDLYVDDLGQQTLVIRGRCDVSNGVIRGGTAVGLTVERLRATNLTVRDNGKCGVSSKRVQAFGSTITGNERGGLCANGVGMRNSSATGNGVAPGCTAGPCADISTLRKPRLRDSTCDRSTGNPEPPGDWNVCTFD